MTTFNKIKKKEEKAERDLTKERNERCEPIAKDIIRAIANFDGPSLITEDRMAFVKGYDPLIIEIIGLLQEHNLPVEEWGYVMQIAQIPIDHVKGYVGETISKNITEAMEAFWGKKEGQITLTDIALKKRNMIR